MIRRKTPYKHHVRRHYRRDKRGNRYPVTDYDRGKGRPVRKTPRRRRVVGKKSSSSYVASIVYPDTSSESATVTAPNWASAIDAGLKKRERMDKPKEVRVRLR